MQEPLFKLIRQPKDSEDRIYRTLFVGKNIELEHKDYPSHTITIDYYKLFMTIGGYTRFLTIYPTPPPKHGSDSPGIATFHVDYSGQLNIALLDSFCVIRGSHDYLKHIESRLENEHDLDPLKKVPSENIFFLQCSEWHRLQSRVVQCMTS